MEVLLELMSLKFLFESWTGIVSVVAIGTSAYLALILLLRISGKRTLSKMNAFDLIVTVAFGSTLAAVLLNKSVPLAEGVTAFALLITLQHIVTWLSVRFNKIDELVKAEPAMLYYRGQLLHQVMCRERVTEGKVHTAACSQVAGSLTDIDTVVMETDGTMNCDYQNRADGPEAVSTLHKVKNYPLD